ncbi:MAG: hypothetical protein CFE21_05555 [Bacteroidetes bacterium B1(2017)]|nr:MAG: hypothetical protein CFE21_05555 [Bacteroidetes bacterium B1(2017)]
MEVNKNDSFVIFRLPNSKEIFQVVGNAISLDLNLPIPTNVFLMAPFNGETHSYGIPFAEQKLFDGIFPEPNNFLENTFENKGKEHYETIVQMALRQMNENAFKKVVLANSKTIKKNHLSIEQVFNSIEKAYPLAFVYYLSSPQTGTWIGASPEPLLVGSNQNFTTVAMAGTIRNDQESSWTEKEKIEQNWVELYLESLLQKYHLPFQKTLPFTYISGKLSHIRTEFSFSCSDQSKLSEFLVEINPTPAVGGLPKKESLTFINDKENLERTFYAGFLGLYTNSNIQLFVNLRCLTIQEESLTLFAGAGITLGSDPEKEWYETQNKMNALEQFLS